MESRLKEEEARAAAAAQVRAHANEGGAGGGHGTGRNGHTSNEHWLGSEREMLTGTRATSEATAHRKKEDEWQWRGASAQVEQTRALVQELKDDILRRHKALMAR
jgi:hypothetical protein